MKNLGTIQTEQPRIATGRMGDAKTRFFVVRTDYHYDGHPAITTDTADYEGYEVVGYYDVIHSSILAGSWEDFEEDIRRIINRRLVEDGHARPARDFSNFREQGMNDEPVL